MNIAELIALAKIRSGKSQKEMATDMGYTHPNQVSKIATGIKAANASEIIYLAEAAHMPPIKVLAEIEAERHPELAFVWKSIREKITSLYQSLADRQHFPAAAPFCPMDRITQA